MVDFCMVLRKQLTGLKQLIGNKRPHKDEQQTIHW